MRAKRVLLLAGVLAGAAFALVAACGGDDGGVSPPGADATAPDGAAGGDDGATDGGDAGADAGGETVDDGGANVDFDGGDDTADDAGPCNLLEAGVAPAVASTCQSTLPLLTGGALVGGRYFLEGVDDLGSKSFCSSTFFTAQFDEVLDLTIAGTTATANTATRISSGASVLVRHATATFTTTADNSSPMEGQTVCPAANAPGDVRYRSSVVAGKQTIAVLLPYGKGAAVYHFARQP